MLSASESPVSEIVEPDYVEPIDRRNHRKFLAFISGLSDGAPR
jgi:hypothetical protein